jgi:hypothetical protein
MGVVGDYRWGAPRRKAMLAWEDARRNGPAEDNELSPLNDGTNGSFKSY